LQPAMAIYSLLDYGQLRSLPLFGKTSRYLAFNRRNRKQGTDVSVFLQRVGPQPWAADECRHTSAVFAWGWFRRYLRRAQRQPPLSAEMNVWCAVNHGIRLNSWPNFVHIAAPLRSIENILNDSSNTTCVKKKAYDFLT
jgi:hypothetical protein